MLLSGIHRSGCPRSHCVIHCIFCPQCNVSQLKSESVILCHHQFHFVGSITFTLTISSWLSQLWFIWGGESRLRNVIKCAAKNGIINSPAPSAFHCCILELIRLGLLSKGMPNSIFTFLHNHLTKTEFNVIAGGFTFKNRYRGGSTSFGSGQRGGASGFHWNINQDITNKALEVSKTQMCVIHHHITREVQSNNGIVFADDLTKTSMSSIE